MKITHIKLRFFRKVFLFLSFFFLCSSSILIGQNSHKTPLTSQEYLENLSNSKDSLYNEIIRNFNLYLTKHPNDVSVRIHRCEVIEKSYYDSYEDYNPKQEEFDFCLDQLLKDFPLNQEVLLYKLKRVYGDSAKLFSEKVIERNVKNPGLWNDRNLALFYQKLAQINNYENNNNESIKYAKIAQGLNDTLDLSILLANNYIDLKNLKLAESILISKLDSTKNLWELRTKANLLLKVGNAEKALEAYKAVMKDSSIWIDEENVANVLLKNGHYDQAREFFLKDMEGGYRPERALQQLYQFDYKYSIPDTALSTYNKLMDVSFTQDAFGKYRIQMLLKKPFSGWQFSDILKFLLSLLIILLLFLIPYLWVLPLYFLSNKYFRNKKQLSLEGSEWGLKDFWLVSSAILILQFIYLFIFNYGELLSYFNDDVFIEEEVAVNPTEATGVFFYFSMMAIIVAVFVIKRKKYFLGTGNWTIGRCIGNGIGAALSLKICHAILVKIGVFPSLDFSGEATIVESIQSINQFYHPFIGFILIVIIVPVYEEYLFRAILLTAMEKRVGYIISTILQSVFFALMHDNLGLFFFYVAFGLVAGHFVRKSDSILPGIIFHSTNNFIAFMAILFLS